MIGEVFSPAWCASAVAIVLSACLPVGGPTAEMDGDAHLSVRGAFAVRATPTTAQGGDPACRVLVTMAGGDRGIPALRFEVSIGDEIGSLRSAPASVTDIGAGVYEIRLDPPEAPTIVSFGISSATVSDRIAFWTVDP